MKKLLCALLSLVMIFSFLSACAQDTVDTPEATDTATAATDTPEQTEAPLSGSITLMASQNWIKDVDRELFAKFQEETGVEVKVLVTPDNGYDTLLGTSLSGGSDAIDIFMYSGGSPMIAAGIPEIALDLSSEPWVANMADWAIEANSVDGVLLGFSTWSIDYEGILYNQTLFEENGWEVPSTWADFLTLCDAVQAAGITPFYEGINGVWHTQSWFYALTPVIAAEMPDYAEYLNTSKDNKWADIQAVTDGLTQIRDFLSHSPAYFTNDGQSEDWYGSYDTLTNRECAMMFTYTAYAAELAANGSTDTWGMFPCPLLDNTVAVNNGGGISKFINKNSDNIEACKALLSFLAEDENLETYYAARQDMVTAAFQGVESAASTTATIEMTERSTAAPVTMMIKSITYWDPDIYQYMQGFAAGTTSVEDFIAAMDDYRATMFDTAG